MAELAIDVRDLTKTYRTPFTRRKVEALRGVTFGVERGHIFGFVGPNGAGKTTAIRTLMGLVRPSSGSATLLGHPLASRAARFKIGFLPESPYFYDYLDVAELCDLAGRLFGLAPADRKKRADELIERVGLGRARGQSLKKFSKGMLQRAGLAQALMNDPELVVLDEPMSGLDPIGRKEVRDLILELRDRGKTVFFSTHILSDVEAITDRVAIIARGQLQAHGTPAELVSRTLQGVDVIVKLAPPAGGDGAAAGDDPGAALAHGATRVRRVGEELSLTLAPDTDVDAWIARAHAAGARVLQIAPRHETLEDLFVRQVAGAEPPRAAPATGTGDRTSDRTGGRTGDRGARRATISEDRSRGVGTPTAVPAGRESSPVGSISEDRSRGVGTPTAVPAARGSSPVGSIGRIWAIALNTFREAARIRVLYGIVVLVIGSNLLALVLGQLSVQDGGRVARDVGLAGISLFGSLTAIFLGVFLLYTEVQRRTIHAIVTKPISRWEFVVGKYTGMVLVLSVLVAVFSLAMVMMLVVQGTGVSSGVVKAVILCWFEVLTVAAIAIFFSSFSTPFLSGIFALAMWVIGRLTPDLEAATRDAAPWIRDTTRIALEIVPDIHLFAVSGRTLDGATVSVHGDFVPWGYLELAGAHGLGWIVALLALAALLFHRRDFV